MTAPDGAAPTPGSLRDRLRAIPVFAGELPDLDPATAPDDPVTLFLTWLDDAIAAGVREPHAMTVATAGPDGAPSSRVVVLKDVVDGALQLATDARSGKAQDLTANPQVALGFWWSPLGRQVRIEGRARVLGAAESAADFLARSPASRAAALAVRPGELLGSREELRVAIADAERLVAADPDLVLPEWQVWEVVPHRVELWQGRADRAHTRLVYRSVDGVWERGLVWP